MLSGLPSPVKPALAPTPRRVAPVLRATVPLVAPKPVLLQGLVCGVVVVLDHTAAPFDVSKVTTKLAANSDVSVHAL